MNREAAIPVEDLVEELAPQRRFRPYPEYIESGVSWLGRVPDHWQVAPLGRYLRVKSGDMTSATDLVDEGYPVFGGNGFRGYITDWNTEANTIIIGRYGALCGNVRVARERIWATEHAFRVYPLQQFHADFFAYLIDSLNLNQFSARTAQPGLNSDIVRRNTVAIPPLAEQRAIAAFLDRETARIDELIAKKQRLIELLAEKRTALISHAVTKGLNPNAPMKDSGIEWLGEMPKHWKAVQLRRVLRSIEQGWSPSCINYRASHDEWGVLKAGAVNSGRLDEKENKLLPPDLEPEPSLEVRPGDVLMSRACGTPSLVGSVAFVDACRPRLLLCDKLFRLHTEQQMSAEFIALSLRSTASRAQIEGSINGAEGLANNITQATVRSLWVGIPPLDEQHEICEEIRVQRSRLRELRSQINAAIENLREYRSALISAAVIGKIDVRGEVAG